jgi:hypothetical protein
MCISQAAMYLHIWPDGTRPPNDDSESMHAFAPSPGRTDAVNNPTERIGPLMTQLMLT